MSEDNNNEDLQNTAKKNEVLTFSIKRDNLWKYSTFVLAGIVVLGFIFFALPNNGGATGAVIGTQPTAPSEGPSGVPAPTANLEIEAGDWVKGDPDAPVKMFEYSDFECPFCGRFFDQTLSQIESQYIDTGKVAFVYKHFPLTSIHPNAQKAAEAAECAGDQGKFWEMHDLIFQNQASLGISTYKAWAGQLGLNQAEFDSCLDSGEKASIIAADFSEGSSLGIRGTPGFIIDGRLVSGAQPFTVFQQVIEAGL